MSKKELLPNFLNMKSLIAINIKKLPNDLVRKYHIYYKYRFLVSQNQIISAHIVIKDLVSEVGYYLGNLYRESFKQGILIAMDIFRCQKCFRLLQFNAIKKFCLERIFLSGIKQNSNYINGKSIINLKNQKV
ncbi:hypothetical protein [Schleiferia thermophila]|uniref:Uncharacterized protein n=1 Tax=Schleiferia thermophila TaxID=884107 RepID=A0A369A322_9FLAO|nr:hypothetical protein [Schleiferia thermophila]RCX03609.1 hypothetical protein DES35_10258 [Schleiferia thermophila]GCD79843.1 hypothetical protein JCM30197_10900 [Schleiferia thermophila]